MSNSRVIDGDRTRDNRNHNPLSELWFRAFRAIREARKRGERLRNASVGVPGPSTAPETLVVDQDLDRTVDIPYPPDSDVLAPLRRVAT